MSRPGGQKEEALEGGGNGGRSEGAATNDG